MDTAAPGKMTTYHKELESELQPEPHQTQAEKLDVAENLP